VNPNQRGFSPCLEDWQFGGENNSIERDQIDSFFSQGFKALHTFDIL
jgi:hypothetical protein